MRRWLGVVALGATLWLGGCAAGRNPDLLAALQRATITEVVVEVAPGMAQGLISQDVNGVADKDKAPVVAQAVKTALGPRVVGKSGGLEKARLRITLTQLDMGTAAGRIIGGSSRMSGSARIEAVQGGQLIAHLGDVTAEDNATRGSGNIGVFVALAANAISAASEDRIKVLSEAFADQVTKLALP